MRVDSEGRVQPRYLVTLMDPFGVPLADYSYDAYDASASGDLGPQDELSALMQGEIEKRFALVDVEHIDIPPHAPFSLIFRRR